MDETRNPWKSLSQEVRYENPWIRVVHHEVLNPSGKPGIYGVVQYRNLAVGVIPVDQDGHTWLVGQYRFPLDRYSWEIPEGGAPEGSTGQESALRELQEETGLAASSIAEVVRLDLSNSVSNESGVVYLAWDLTQGQPAPEETEQLKLRRVPLKEAVALVLDGTITDSLSVAGLLRLRLLHDDGRIPAGAAEAVARGLA
ncbi:NUDIX hydrolase [Aerophototrophica crusticola]|uniref:GDP-mannose pyrophosphatase n=1 Tax=Aerophototrophica crusticola TaxID=1709002 RepID=A0A858R655_9PROT|nr:NUDIX hydrolase [Rhodospirillaceae bacterium B3]